MHPPRTELWPTRNMSPPNVNLLTHVIRQTQFSLLIICFVFHKDSPGWDGGRSNGFVNGYHDNRTNGGFGGRGPSRNDRGGRGAYRGNRGGGSFNQPLQNAGREVLFELK